MIDAEEDRDALVVVPSELHVEALARKGIFAETRRSLFLRLSRALLRDVAVATRTEAALAEAHAAGSPLLGAALGHVLDALTDAHGTEANVKRALAKTRMKSFAKTSEAAIALLSKAGLVHPRKMPELLTAAIHAADPELVARIVGRSRVIARGLYEWSAPDGAFFRALDQALSRAGGGATVILPEVDASIDTTREDSPHDAIAEACAKGIDAAPQFERTKVPATFVGAVDPRLAARASVVLASDRDAEASACASLVLAAIARGVPADAIGVALPRRGGAEERVIARALSEAGVLTSRGNDEIADAPLVTIAWQAFEDAATPRATRAKYVQFALDSWAESELFAKVGVGAFGVLAKDAREDALDRAELDAVTATAAAWDALSLVDYSAAIARLGIADAEIDRDAFVREAKAALPPARDPAARRAGAVRIGTLLDFSGAPMELVVVLRSNEGADARSIAIEDAEVKSRARVMAAAHAVRIATLFESSVKVAFTCRSRDADGGELAPAPWVAWLLRGGVVPEHRGASPLDPARTSPRDRRLRDLLSDADRARNEAPFAFERAAIERTREAFFLDATRRASPIVGALAPSPALRDAVVAETGGADAELAITSLERAAGCPFVGYAECVLGARKKIEDARVPDAREEGNLVHEALAAAFVACREPLSSGLASRQGEEIVFRGLAEVETLFESRDPPLSRVIIERVRVAVEALLRLAAEDPRYRFFAAEQAFGTSRDPVRAKSAWPAFTIEEGQDKITLRGSVDRVDVSSDGARARVIDYKRRKRTIQKNTRSLGVTSLQVPLYAVVAARALGKEPGESGFLPTEPKDLADPAPPKTLLDALARTLESRDGKTAIERRALDVVRELRGGTFTPTPLEADACTRCSHHGACRRPRFTIEPELD